MPAAKHFPDRLSCEISSILSMARKAGAQTVKINSTDSVRRREPITEAEYSSALVDLDGARQKLSDTECAMYVMKV